MPGRRVLAAVAALLALATACTPSTTGSPTSAPGPTLSGPTLSPPDVSTPTALPPSPSPSTPQHSVTPSASQSSATPVNRAAQVLAAMTEAQRVGQLFMIDCPSTSLASATRTAIMTDHVGSVILDGTSQLSLADTAALTSRLQQLAPSGVGLFISTDQEGGEVQRLQGSGFTRIPSALVQGGESPAALVTQAQQWGRELAAAGVNVDLGPVLDTVPAGSTNTGSPNNPPIGNLDREYGHTPATVTSHGAAVARGLALAGVDATIKHFPGLGRVTGNTDLSSNVRDTVTTSTDPYLAPFAAAVQQGVPFVMMSTAIYTQIDASRPAAFSPVVIGLLRHQLGFSGVVISDDLGAAAQVGGYSVGTRAVDFVAAGGDIVLTVVASQAAKMTAAVLAKAKSDPAFKAQVDAAALTVLQAKLARGLLH